MSRVDAFASIGPGRYSCRADARVDRITLDGCCDSIGDVDAIGWHASLVDGPLLGLARAGAIVSTDSQGLVTVEYFDDAAAMKREWDRLYAAADEDMPCECDIADCDRCHPVTLDCWRVSFAAFSGCSPLPRDYADDEQSTARAAIATLIRRRRAAGMTVCRLADDRDGISWEVSEPDDAVMVSDMSGILTLRHVVERSR